MSIVGSLFRAARTANKVSVATSGDPKRVAKFAKNRALLRFVGPALRWPR